MNRRHELPFGAAGRVAHPFFVRGQIESVFAYRKNRLNQILANVKSRSPRSQLDQAASA